MAVNCVVIFPARAGDRHCRVVRGSKGMQQARIHYTRSPEPDHAQLHLRTGLLLTSPV